MNESKDSIELQDKIAYLKKKKGFLFDLGFKFSDSLMDNET